MTSRMSWLPRALLACAVVTVSACVDETGYECPDGEFVTTSDLCVDETGYLDLDLVDYTAAAPLDDAPRPVTLLGQPGALPGEGTLEVEGASGAVDAVVGPDEDGAFLVSLTAALDDELTLRFTPLDGEEGADRVILNDALDGVTAPAIASAPLVSAADGTEVTVFLSSLASAGPPFVVFNEDASEPVVLFTDAADDVTLPASTGQSVCVFHVRPDDGAQSTQVCQTVPEA